jgi:acetyltransferase-like isoleucine patch superfamily enzyme
LNYTIEKYALMPSALTSTEMDEEEKMMELANLFDLKSGFPHMEIFEENQYPWEAVKGISKYMQEWLHDWGRKPEPIEMIDWGWLQEDVNENGAGSETLYVTKKVCLECDFFFKISGYGIFLGAGSILEPAAFIQSPVIVGKKCEIRHGAYLRGNVIVGDNSVLGHTTEVKNSIMMNHSGAGHFSYIGDSIIGNYVNLGAGTILANLEFRTGQDKKYNNKKTIKIIDGNCIIETEMFKLGAIIGDGGELGCNCVTSPGVILGKESMVFPTNNVKKGIYPPGSKL